MSVSEKRRAARKVYDKRYRMSEKGRAAVRRYNLSEKRRAAHRRYKKTAKGVISYKRYSRSEARRNADKRYRMSEKGRAASRRYARSDGGRFTRNLWMRRLRAGLPTSGKALAAMGSDLFLGRYLGEAW